MNRSRLVRLEERLKPAPRYHRVDPDTGWNILGGGPGASGVLFTPPVSRSDDWLAAGENRS